MAPDTSTATDADAQAALADIERLGGQLRAARTSIGKVIYGQQDVIDQTLVALLSGGHLLLIGVPGLAKTKLVDTLGVVLVAGVILVTFTSNWAMIGNFFATAGLFGTYLWSLVITAISAVAGFFILAKATPRN